MRLLQPIKQVVRELANRYGDRGGTHELTGFAMLHLDELRGAMAEPGEYRESVAQRGTLHARFAAAPARFLITGADDVPTIETLEAVAPRAVGVAGVGEVLAGAVGSPGVATGRVRIVLDPADCADLAAGEILVCPITDPAWTPLFIPAAAVVVNVGALLSHAIVVSRELGIPCVAAVPSATLRLVDGMLVTVDGNQGTVTVVDR